MARTYGSQSMVDPLRIVLVRSPDASFSVADPVPWGYTARPDLGEARAEHAAFVALLERAGVEVRYHGDPQPGRADSIFVHDPAAVTDRGAILLRMGKELRRGEEGAMEKAFHALGVPILGTLRGDATAEGGDLLWIDHDRLAIGQGFRTNAEGFRQLTAILREADVQTMPVHLPYDRGPASCLHLMSVISLVDHDLAVIYPRLLPVPLWQHLKEERFEFVDVPDEEFDTMAPNVLAVAPRHCIMLEGNPITKARLEDAGCRVETYRGREISLKAEGGATCLTRPILRDR